MPLDLELDPETIALRFSNLLGRMAVEDRDGIGGVVVVNGFPRFYGVTMERLTREDAELVLDTMKEAILDVAFKEEET